MIAQLPLNFNRSAEPVEARLKVCAEADKRPSTGSGLRLLLHVGELT
jgi:hypothetical protein